MYNTALSTTFIYCLFLLKSDLKNGVLLCVTWSFCICKVLFILPPPSSDSPHKQHPDPGISPVPVDHQDSGQDEAAGLVFCRPFNIFIRGTARHPQDLMKSRLGMQGEGRYDKGLYITFLKVKFFLYI